MPRFYFHLLNDIDASDDEGVELPDMEAARAETAKDPGKVMLHHRIDIENEEGAVLDTVHFGDAVTVQP
jgi:hypothetical protein